MELLSGMQNKLVTIHNDTLMESVIKNSTALHML